MEQEREKFVSIGDGEKSEKFTFLSVTFHFSEKFLSRKWWKISHFLNWKNIFEIINMKET